MSHWHKYFPTIVPGLERCGCGSTQPASQPTLTSEEAAEKIAPSVRGLRRRVYDFIKQGGAPTDEQICTALGMNPSTERPRRVELVRAGLVRDSGEYGTTAAGRRATRWEPV